MKDVIIDNLVWLYVPPGLTLDLVLIAIELLGNANPFIFSDYNIIHGWYISLMEFVSLDYVQAVTMVTNFWRTQPLVPIGNIVIRTNISAINNVTLIT